jgi:hypothetical protein
MGKAKNMKMEETGALKRNIFSGKRIPKILGKYSPMMNEISKKAINERVIQKGRKSYPEGD